MKKTNLLEPPEWQSPALVSIAELFQSDAFVQFREHQLQMSRAIAPVLDNIHKHQELIQKSLPPGITQATNTYAAMAMAAKPAVEAMAAWQQPLAEVSATIAAQQKLCAQMARATKLTAMQEMLQNIPNFTIPAVQVTTPKIDEALSAINYMEENQPELCQQVDAALATGVEIDDKPADIDDYLLLCEQTMVGISCLIAVTNNPEVKAGLLCLFALFSQLFIYLKHSKTQQEKEKS